MALGFLAKEYLNVLFEIFWDRDLKEAVAVQRVNVAAELQGSAPNANRIASW